MTTNLSCYIIGYFSCALFVFAFSLLDYVVKIRKAKHTIKKTVSSCSDIDELIFQLNQLKKIFTYENFKENEVKKDD